MPAVALSVDERAQIQVLGRTRASLPMKPGHPETRTRDSKRHGAARRSSSPSAVMRVAGSSPARMRVTLDKVSSRKSAEVHECLKDRPAGTSASLRHRTPSPTPSRASSPSSRGKGPRTPPSTRATSESRRSRAHRAPQRLRRPAFPPEPIARGIRRLVELRPPEAAGNSNIRLNQATRVALPVVSRNIECNANLRMSNFMPNKSLQKVAVDATFDLRWLDNFSDKFEVLEFSHSDAARMPKVAQPLRAIIGHSASAPDFDLYPSLEIFSNFGVGYESVDSAYAAKRGIVVTNTPGVLTEETADTALGLLLNTLRELPRAEAYLRAGRWKKEGDYPLTQGTLRGRKAGIFGLGRIGKAIARRLSAFGVPVSYCGRTRQAELELPYFERLVDLASSVDILIASAPGGASTRHAVNAEVLAALGPNGVLINIGRGSVVDEAALISALSRGAIMAAGLDVYENEPQVGPKLLSLANTCLLPHVGSASVATRRSMAELAALNVVSWIEDGKALTPVAETAHLAEKSWDSGALVGKD